MDLEEKDKKEREELLDHLLKAQYHLMQALRHTHRHKVPEIARTVERCFTDSMELAKNFPKIFSKYRVINIIVDMGKDRK